jgi:hypothetical protein
MRYYKTYVEDTFNKKCVDLWAPQITKNIYFNINNENDLHNFYRSIQFHRTATHFSILIGTLSRLTNKRVDIRHE